MTVAILIKILAKWQKLLTSVDVPEFADLKQELSALFIDKIAAQLSSTTARNNAAEIDDLNTQLNGFCWSKIGELRSHPLANSSVLLNRIQFTLYETHALLALYSLQAKEEKDRQALYAQFTRKSVTAHWNKLMLLINEQLKTQPDISVSLWYKKVASLIDGYFFTYFIDEYRQLVNGDIDDREFIECVLEEMKAANESRLQEFMISYLALFGITCAQYPITNDITPVGTNELFNLKGKGGGSYIPLPTNSGAQKAAKETSASIISALIKKSHRITDALYDSISTLVHLQKKPTSAHQHWISPADLVNPAQAPLPLLHWALSVPNKRLLDLLITQFGPEIMTTVINPNTQETCLHYLAATTGDWRSIQTFFDLFLKDYVAIFSFLKLKNNKGQTFFHVLLMNKHFSHLELRVLTEHIITDLLNRQNAQPELKKLLFSITDNDQMTVFAKAAQEGFYATVDFLFAQLHDFLLQPDNTNKIDLLMDAFLPHNKFNKSPLYLSATTKSIITHHYLLTRGAAQLVPEKNKNSLLFSDNYLTSFSAQLTRFESTEQTAKIIAALPCLPAYWALLYRHALATTTSALERRNITQLLNHLNPHLETDNNWRAKDLVLSQITALQTLLNGWEDYRYYIDCNPHVKYHPIEIKYALFLVIDYMTKKQLMKRCYNLMILVCCLVSLSVAIAFGAIGYIDAKRLLSALEPLEATYWALCNSYGGHSFKPYSNYDVSSDCCHHNSTCVDIALPLHEQYLTLSNDASSISMQSFLLFLFSPLLCMGPAFLIMILDQCCMDACMSFLMKKVTVSGVQHYLAAISEKLTAFIDTLNNHGITNPLPVTDNPTPHDKLSKQIEFISLFLAKYKTDIENSSGPRVAEAVTLPTDLPLAPTSAPITRTWQRRNSLKVDIETNIVAQAVNEKTALLGAP